MGLIYQFWKQKHIRWLYVWEGESEELVTNSSSWLIEARAEVGLLSHNIRILGADDGTREAESYGGRVLVGRETVIEDGQLKVYHGTMK